MKQRKHHNGLGLSLLCSILFIIFCTNILLAKDSKLDHLEKADLILTALSKADFTKVSEFVHAEKGIRFSPYDQIELRTTKSKKYPNEMPNITFFKKSQLPGFMFSEKILVWGNYTGSGFHIILAPNEYFKKFIYDIDYLSKTKARYVSVNELQDSDELEYVFDTYSRNSVVEFRYKGTASVGFNNFKKLIMVFETIDNELFLVGIVHSEKTY